MADTSLVGQVDAGDLMGAEVDAVFAVDRQRSDCQAFALKRLRHFPKLALEADVSLGGGDGTDDVVPVVLQFWQAVRHGAKARSIAAGRDLLLECLMWPLEVIDLAPLIERALHLGEITEASKREYFILERTMEAFVLAAALWVIRPAVQDGDAELQEPHTKPGPACLRGIPPGAAVVDEQRLWQAIVTEGCLQMALHRDALFIGAGLEARHIARMVVHHGQRMAAHPIAEPDPALEVHLPQQVRRRPLEALRGPRRAGRRNYAAVPPQNLVHGRKCGRLHPLAFETARDLARPPGRMCVPYLQHESFHCRITARRTRMRPPRAIAKVPVAANPAGKPLVAGIGMDPEPPAQLPPVRVFLLCQSNKLTPLVHNRYLSPRHGWPPCCRIHAMMKCRVCLRTGVGYVPGLNT